MPVFPHSRALSSLHPDAIVLVLLALCVVVAAASTVAYLRCRREEHEFDCALREILRRVRA